MVGGFHLEISQLSIQFRLSSVPVLVLIPSLPSSLIQIAPWRRLNTGPLQDGVILTAERGVDKDATKVAEL